MANAYIPEKTTGVYSSVTDLTKVVFPAADIHSLDGSGRGSAKSWDFDEMYKAMMYRLFTAAAHGLVSGDVGKPVSGSTILDDTATTHYPSGVLVQVVSTSVIRVAPPGTEVTLAVALLTGGAAYSIASSGRYVYWDASGGLYTGTIPVDSAPEMPEILELTTVGATTFTARVCSY